ncbi:MAG: sensor histidine kinase [Pseudomonadota bacterium]|uniref:sensor histidine kinase n=1 Tax=Roseixanthobacter finlandensis TaxID=3119922 RepID=UPI00372B5726
MNVLVKPTLPDASLLMREITHRISNEFASAVYIVSLAASRSGDQQVQSALGNVQQHLEHYARVHRALQMPDLGTTVDVADYLCRLCHAVSRSKLDSLNIKIVIAAQPMALASERCWMLGMIVNELITNAVRHAFSGQGGTIRVGLIEKEGVALCIVTDNGRNSGKSRSQGGLKIISSLAESLNGNFSWKFGAQGSASIVVFPVHSN